MTAMSADNTDSGHIVHLVADRVATIVVVAVTITVVVSIVVCC